MPNNETPEDLHKVLMLTFKWESEIPHHRQHLSTWKLQH